MAKTARFPIDAFERGRLPRICALSGEPTTDHMNVTVETTSGLPWLILGAVPFLLAAHLGRKVAVGQLPMTEEVYRVVKRKRKVVPGIALTGVALIAVGLALIVRFNGRIGLLAALAGVVVLLVGRIHANARNPLGAMRIDKTGRWIELPRAADRFADAVSGAVKAGII
jgi:hypothetical protein